MIPPEVDAIFDAIDVASDMHLMWFAACAAAVVHERNDEAEPAIEVDGWDPWEALRREPSIELEWRQLPDGMGGKAKHKRPTPMDTGAIYAEGFPLRYVIVLDPRLDPWKRAAVLTHELLHHERGLGLFNRDQDNSTEANDARMAEEAEVRRHTRLRMAFYRPNRRGLAL